MPWEPAQSSSRASNRWRPPSPSPATPVIPVSTLKRESWRPTSSWTPVARANRQTQPEPQAAESSQSQAGRAPLPDRGSTDRSPSPPPYRARETRPGPDDDAEYGRRGHGSKRDRRGGGGGGGDGDRSWEAWKHKVEAVSAKRVDEDRRPGPSRRDDYTTFDRMREQKDQATGRSWSAWQSKIGTGSDDRERRQPVTGNRDRDRAGRERDEGWKARSRAEDDGRRPGSDRERKGSRATSRDNHDGRSRLDERDDQDEGVPPARRRPRESKEKNTLPYSPDSRSPTPPPRKRSPSPVKRRKDESPKRATTRRASPDYGRAPTKNRRSPSPSPARRRVPDRGSPDYALGAEERDRNRDRDTGGSAVRARPRGSDTSPSTSFRPRSPSPPTRARRHDSPSARPRDRSPSASSVSSVASRRRDHSTGDRQAVAPRWRRERSEEDRNPAPGRGPLEDRHKRPRRESPDYAERRRTSPGPVIPLSTPNPPLSPQESSYHGVRAGSSMTHQIGQANQANEAEDRRQGWSRDRLSHNDAPRSRGLRRDSPDYDGHRTRPMPGRNEPRSEHRAPENGRLQTPSNPNQISVTRTWGRPQNSSLSGTLQASESFTLSAPPTTDSWSDSKPSDSFVPVSGFQASSSQVGRSPIKGSSSPVKIDFGHTTSPKASVVSGKRAPGLRQFFDADSPAHPDFNSNPPSGSHTPNTYPPSGRDSEAEMEIDTPPIDTTLQAPDVYLHKIAESEKQYTQHLDTIAPYIRSAFKEWSELDQTRSLPAFLVHYFGRQPDERELHQIEQLIKLRRRTSKDQEGLRDLHARATKDTKRDRTKGATNAKATSPARLSPSRNGHDRTVSKIESSAESSAETGKTPVDSQDPNPSGRRAHTDETYERLACVGEGTYGKVYKARRVDDGVFVALKRIRMEVEKDGFPVTAMREIKLLQSLKHDNIIRLHEMMVSKGSVYMVFDYMEHDLTGLLSHPGISFSPANIKSLNHQMLSGLGYLHRVGILHRDMKGSNILLTAQGELKLADFGLARLYNRKRKADYTNRVITLWYRSPELLLGETAYGPEVDMWSAGCIMLEIYYTKPILQGNDEIHQLEVIYGLMGTPREEDWPTVRDLPWYELVKPKTELRSKFKESFSKRLSPAAMELAEGLLAMNPAKRLSAKKALQTAYFVSEEPRMAKPAQLAGIGEHHEMSAKQERHRRKAEGQ